MHLAEYIYFSTFMQTFETKIQGEGLFELQIILILNRLFAKVLLDF